MAGRVVSVTTLTQANGTVSFGSELAEGVYMVRLVGSEGLLDQERIVKTK
jgi:hypothetical protein